MRTRSGLVSFAVMASLAAGMVATAPMAHAGKQGFNVNSTADLVDTDPGDGDCLAANGKCTLRAAVQEASKQGGEWIINVPAGTFNLTRTPTNENIGKGGDLDVKFAGRITGAGPGATTIHVDRTKVEDRVFDILQAEPLVISQMKIENGFIGPGDDDSDGGAILQHVAATLRLVHVVITGNHAHTSGGAVSFQGALTVQNSVLKNNDAENNGGAIRSYGDVTVIGSTLSGNSAGAGGAINPNLAVTVKNSTIEGNTGGGGGISGGSGPVTIVNSTLANNGTFNITGDATLQNSILATPSSGDDCSGTIAATNSLIDDTNDCTITGTGNVTDQPAKLGPLQNNGGPTPTMALLPGSPARNAGDQGTCLLRDQRGVRRTQGSSCDIGAYEVPYPKVTKPSASTVHQAHVTVAWLVPGGPAGAKFFDVRYRDRPAGGGGFGAYHSLLDHTALKHTTFTATFGLQYCFSARAIDAGGNQSPFGAERCVKVVH
jgi:CSLREA domain-containing protein